MSKFTPGPWHVGEPGKFSVNAANGHGICEVLAYIDNPGFGNKDLPIDAEANARLIAAAPTMYDALKSALYILDGLCEDSRLSGEPECRIYSAHRAMVAKAIAQAEGE